MEDMKDPVEVHSPGADRLPVIVRVEELSGDVLLVPFDDLPLDLGDGPAIWGLVNGSPGVCITGPTHAVNCPIASNTD